MWSCKKQHINGSTQSSTLLSHQDILSPSLSDDFESKIEGSGSDDEDNDGDIRLPGNEIPKWFNHVSVGNSIFFWVGRKLPKFVICIALELEAQIGGFGSEVYLSINGCEKICINSISMYEIFDHLWYLLDLIGHCRTNSMTQIHLNIITLMLYVKSRNGVIPLILLSQEILPLS